MRLYKSINYIAFALCFSISFYWMIKIQHFFNPPWYIGIFDGLALGWAFGNIFIFKMKVRSIILDERLERIKQEIAEIENRIAQQWANWLKRLRDKERV